MQTQSTLTSSGTRLRNLTASQFRPSPIAASSKTRGVSHRSTQGRWRTQRVISRRRSSRRSGVALIYTALGLSSFLGVTALVVDMGNLYTRRAQAQRAADAAALAGALELPQGAAAADFQARQYALKNGYDAAKGEVPRVDLIGSPPNQVRVHVQRQEPLFFLPAVAALLGSSASSSIVGADATAQGEFSQFKAELSTLHGSQYGSSRGVANPSTFGPQSRYEYGDPYSPLYLGDGTTPNTGPAGEPRGADFPGFEYTLNIGANYKTTNGTGEVQLELFDPDSYTTDPAKVLDWDEAHYSDQNQPHEPTVTQYTLKSPSGATIATATYGDGAATNLTWATPDGFKFDIDQYGGPGAYKLFVKALAGTDENGFQMRAGKPHDGLTSNSLADETTWSTDYNNGGKGNDTAVTATGKTTLNFTQSGSITIELGFIKTEARGGTVIINKFDTDVGAQDNLVYTCDSLPGQQFPGHLASNGTWGAPPDTIQLPTTYTGGNWKATYQAAAFDTSSWTMDYTLPGGNSQSGVVKLVD